jgi:NADH-quinone oxidoreductase subunit C
MDTTPVLDVLRAELPAADLTEAPALDMPAIVVGRADIVETCRVLRDHPALQFALLVDVIGTDTYPADPRFEIVYLFACLGEAYATGSAAPPRRLRLKVRASGDDPVVPSITGVYRSANWPEREIFDLFGIRFEHHPDLRRILMPDDWEGYPLRKDYPVQIRKDTEAWSPAQLSVEEFAENMRAQRARASRESSRPMKDVPGGE